MEIEEYFSVAFSAFVLIAALRLIFYSPDTETQLSQVQNYDKEIFEYVPRYAISSSDERIQEIINIADSVGYDWRSSKASFYYGCPPEGCYCSEESCLFGLIKWSLDSGPFRVWITPDAFVDGETLGLAVLHEMAHIWQITTRGSDDRYKDFSRWDFKEIDPMEATADCLASAWGAVGYIYYDCPAEAQHYIYQLYLESLR
jgi:hypothetical protein